MGDGTWHWLLKIPGVGDFYSKLILWGFSGPRGRGNEIFVGGSIPNSLGCGCLMIIIYEEKRTSGERHIWQNCGEWGHSRKSSDSHTTLVQGDPRHSGFFFSCLMIIIYKEKIVLRKTHLTELWGNVSQSRKSLDSHTQPYLIQGYLSQSDRL